MSHVALGILLAVAFASAAMGNYAYFRMAREVSKETSYHPPLLKWHWDIKKMYDIYGDLVRGKHYPHWPLVMFRVGMFGLVGCILWAVLLFR
jgi:hypothetical protein